MKSWKDDARRLIVSEKKELKSFPGYWVKVKKYSIQGVDEIQEALREVQKGLDKKAIIELSKKYKQLGLEPGKALTEDVIIDSFTTEQIEVLINNNSLSISKVLEVRIKHGVAEHNFCEEESTKEGMEVFAHDILEYSEIAKEIMGYIEEFNRPLAS